MPHDKSLIGATMLKKYISFSALTLCVGMSMTTLASAEEFDHELQGLVASAEELTNVVNSHTMTAATHFCQLAVLDAHQNKLIDDKMFVQLNAHCIVGDFHAVSYMLGGDFEKEVTAHYTYTGGVAKNLNAAEQKAIETWHAVK